MSIEAVIAWSVWWISLVKNNRKIEIEVSSRDRRFIVPFSEASRLSLNRTEPSIQYESNSLSPG
jgi:hypothetical protein